MEKPDKTAWLEGAFVWDLQGLRNNRIPSHSLPHSTKMFLRALLSFLWNYFCKSWSWGCHMGGGSYLDPVQFSRHNCLWSFSLSSKFQCVWRPRHAEVPKICPFLNLESSERRGLKSCLVPGLGLRRLAIKFIPHKQWGRPHWSPVFYSKIRTGEVCIVNLRINTM